MIETKVKIFRKGERINIKFKFYYQDIELEIVNKFVFWGIIFTIGGSFSVAQKHLQDKLGMPFFS